MHMDTFFFARKEEQPKWSITDDGGRHFTTVAQCIGRGLTNSVYLPRNKACRNQEHLLRQINLVGLNLAKGDGDRGLVARPSTFDRIMARLQGVRIVVKRGKPLISLGRCQAARLQCRCRPLRRVRHRPELRAASGLDCVHGVGAAPHGGPLPLGTTVLPGAGNLALPGMTLATRRRPRLQHGQTITSILATRCMNACADSLACLFTAGICNDTRAACSLSDLQPLASTP